MDNPFVTGILGFLGGAVYTFFWNITHAKQIARAILDEIQGREFDSSQARRTLPKLREEDKRQWELTALPGSVEQAEQEARGSVKLFIGTGPGQKYLPLPQGMTLENFDYFYWGCCKRGQPLSARVLLRENTKDPNAFADRKPWREWKWYMLRKDYATMEGNDTVVMTRHGKNVMTAFYKASPIHKGQTR